MEVPAGWYPDPTVTLTRRYWTGDRWTSRVIDGSDPENIVPQKRNFWTGQNWASYVIEGGTVEKEVPFRDGIGSPRWVPAYVNPQEDTLGHSTFHLISLFAVFLTLCIAVFHDSNPNANGVWDTSLFGASRAAAWFTAFFLGQFAALMGNWFYLRDYKNYKHKLWLYIIQALFIDFTLILIYRMALTN